jgi:hypothetical protein
MVIVTGSGPQLKVTIPPAATAETTASDVQLAAVPVPTVRSGLDVSTGRASAGIVALPFGLPAGGMAARLAGAERLADAETDADGDPDASLAAGAAAIAVPAVSSSVPALLALPPERPHPARIKAATSIKADKKVGSRRAERSLGCTGRL